MNSVPMSMYNEKIKNKNMKHIANKITTAGLGFLLIGCTGQELPDDGRGVVSLQPHFLTGTTDTRSLVSGTASATGGGNVHQINLYVTKNTDNAVYPGITLNGTTGLSQFTYNGTAWTGNPTVNLHNEEARIYAYYPVNVTPTHASGDTHTIPVTNITGTQTFDGANTWNCNVTDYLYGSAQQVSDAPITASNQSFEPAIWMRHALAQVVFKMQTASGRPVDTYDYIKKITMKTDGGTSFLTGSGTMQLKDGVIASLSTAKEISFTPSVNPVQCGANGLAKVVAYGLVAPLSAQLSNVTLTIEIGDKTSDTNKRILSVTNDAAFSVQWEKGKRYVYNLTLTDRAIVVSETSITAWTPATGNGELRPDGF